ncbi:Uncharacterised protein [Vibrio cholerae]|nr:Uncharacterised protein [Vibrio cholerae]
MALACYWFWQWLVAHRARNDGHVSIGAILSNAGTAPLDSVCRRGCVR